MKTALITGVFGQDGAYLSKFLLEKGYEVFGSTRDASSNQDVALKRREAGVNVIETNLASQTCVDDLMRRHRFDEVYNLVGMSSVSASWESPAENFEANVLLPAILLRAISQNSPATKMFQASSSEIFGNAGIEGQDESTVARPVTPYGVAKLASQNLVQVYRESYNLYACTGILFNHESPLRPITFVTKKIVSTLLDISTGGTEPLRLGNLDAQRDWGCAREFVEAMWLMLQRTKPKDYVLATGYSYSVRDFVGFVAETLSMELEWVGAGLDERAINRSDGQVVVEVDRCLFRPSESRVVRGVADLAKLELRWEPQIFGKRLAAQLVNDEIQIKNLCSRAG